MQEVVFEVTIKTLSPLNIGSGNQAKNDKIAATVRDINNWSIIPGTTVKGALKHNFSLIKGEEHTPNGTCNCGVCNLFGKGGYSPSRVYVDDFKLVVGKEKQELRSANRIDRHRKVCVEGALFTKEVVHGIYKGYITAYIEDEQLKNELKAAICLIKEIGSGKSRGLGNIEVEVKEVTE